MWVKKLVLTEFCQHRKLELNLSCGLIGLVGPNGSGKSTCVDAMFAALTNKFDRFAGVKEDCICDLADPKAESSIYLEAEHAGVAFNLYRGLRPPRGCPANSLQIDGRKAITKVPEIQRELESHLGVNAKLIDRYVFVQQREMFSFLSQTPGERAASYQLMCRTQQAQAIYDAIELLLNQHADFSAEVIDNSDTLRANLAATAAKLEEVAQQRTSLAAKLLSDPKLATARDLIRRREHYNRMTAELAQLEERLQGASAQVQAARDLCANRRQLLANSEQKLEGLATAADAARQLLAAWAAYHNSQRQRQGYLQTQAALKAELAGRTPIEPHPRAKERNRLLEERAELQQEITRSQRILQTFARGGQVECPTCGMAVAQMDEHLQRLRDELPSLQGELKDTERLLADIDQQQQDLLSYQHWQQDRQTQLASVEGALASLKAVPRPAGPADLNQPQRVIANHTQAAKEQKLAQTSLATAEQELAALQATAASQQQRRQELSAQQKANAVNDELLARATQALAAHEQARLQVSELDGRLSALKDRKAADEAALAELQARLARSRRAREFGQKLRLIRERVMHRQALPALVAQANLQAMEADISSALDSFGAPFWVEAAENLSFTVHFPGAPPRPAERLSVGQKGVLAVAFRTALASRFGADTGLLVLDEPTADFDSENVRYLAEALTTYAAQVRGRRQVIVITHAAELRSCFDQVIDLGALQEQAA